MFFEEEEENLVSQHEAVSQTHVNDIRSTVWLAQLSQLEFFENFCCRKDDWIENSGYGESAAHDGADGGQEVVERRAGLVVLHSDRVQVVSEIKRRKTFCQMNLEFGTNTCKIKI